MDSMHKKKTHNELRFSLNQGSKQSLRLPCELQPGYVELEERDLGDLLCQAYEYAKNIKFIDESNQVKGNWSELLAANDSILLALIAKHSATEREQRLQSTLHERFDSDVQLLFSILKQIVSMIKEINAWHIRLQHMQTDAAIIVNRRLFEFMQASQDELAMLYGIYRYVSKVCLVNQQKRFLNDNQKIDAVFSQLSSCWRLSKEFKVLDASVSNKQYRYELESLFYYFINAIKSVSQLAQSQIELSLGGKKQEPASALMVAFLELLTKVNSKTNGFTQKHKHFYYRDVLNILPQPGQADETILLIQPNEKSHDKTIEKGTIFLANNDDLKQELTYVARCETTLAPASVTGVANCYLHQDPFNVPAFNLGLINAIDAHYFDDYQFMDKTWKKPDLHKMNPLGGNKSVFGAYFKNSQMRTTEATEIGFIIASQSLLAKQGRRRFHIQLELEERANDVAQYEQLRHEEDAIKQFHRAVFSAFKAYVFKQERMDFKALNIQRDQLIQELNNQGMATDLFIDQAKQSLDALASVQNQHYESFRNAIFSNGFKLAITTDKGWYKIEHHACQCEHNQGRYILTLTFELSDSKPAVIACNAQAHNQSRADVSLLSVDTGLPAIKVLLAEDAEFYLYSLLQNLVLINSSIDVEVKGAKDLVVYNDMGPLDTSAPFQPFGSQPKNGNALIIGSTEFSYKNLHALSINIQWHQLPQQISGFKSYYQDYELNIENEDFKVTSYVLVNGEWQSQNLNNAQELFSLNEQSKLSSHSVVGISDGDLFQAANQQKEPELAYSSNSRSGFVKLQLAGKEVAFAHTAYPHIINKKLVESIKIKQPCEKQLNEPYTPLINKLSVNYKVRSQIHIEQLSKPHNEPLTHQLFCLSPFGVQSLTQCAQEGNAYLLAQYLDASCFYIGLDVRGEISEGILTLYFDLLESSVNRMRAGSPIIEWAWLSRKNTWHLIAAKSIISDTTSGFLKSGIVTLRLPLQALHIDKNQAESDRKEPSILDVNKLWLRVSTRENPRDFCQLRGIATNAIEVTCQHVNIDKPASLAAGSINKLAHSLSGVKSIYQPSASVAGKIKESENAWLQRSAERLRHRNRLVSPWDYERVVLERFDFIHQVKCFPAQTLSIHDGQAQKAPGQLLLVVIPPYQSTQTEQLVEPPEMISAVQLNAIKDYLEPMAADGIGIHICNPNYEYLQVRCSVLFSEGYQDKNPHHALNSALIEYLSSWGNCGPNKQFEWAYYEDEIAAFIHSLPYIDFVTNLSLLKVTNLKEEYYLRTDSVLENQSSRVNRAIEPKYPWCVAIPVAYHGIQILNQKEQLDAKATGYSELEIGSNLILS